MGPCCGSQKRPCQSSSQMLWFSVLISRLGATCLQCRNRFSSVFTYDVLWVCLCNQMLQDVFMNSRQSDDWSVQTSVRFPRVTICDLKVRRLGAVHDYNVQCVLPINLFNEKIFLFVWFWLVFVGVVTLGSLLMWIRRFVYLPGQRSYVKRHLDFVNQLKTDTDRKRKARQFVRQYLSQDGVFVLRLLAHNTSTVTATEFVTALWVNYKDKPTTGLNGDAMTDV